MSRAQRMVLRKSCLLPRDWRRWLEIKSELPKTMSLPLGMWIPKSELMRLSVRVATGIGPLRSTDSSN